MTANSQSKHLHPKDLDKTATELGIGGHLAPEKDAQGYRRRMERRQEIQQKRLKSRDKEKGLILVFTGHGKGKTTAALGMALRTLGHGKKVAIVQFIKGGWEPGEAKALRVFGDSLQWHSFGEGFTWETQDREKDSYLVEKSWEKALHYLADPQQKLVILDEINIALKLGYLDLKDVFKGLRTRPTLTHVALTGRSAPKELIEKADLVTEMGMIHHPFKEQGVKAQEGIEY